MSSKESFIATEVELQIRTIKKTQIRTIKKTYKKKHYTNSCHKKQNENTLQKLSGDAWLACCFIKDIKIYKDTNKL